MSQRINLGSKVREVEGSLLGVPEAFWHAPTCESGFKEGRLRQGGALFFLRSTMRIIISFFLSLIILLAVTGCQSAQKNVVDDELKNLIKTAKTAKQQIPSVVREAYTAKKPIVLFFYGNWDQVSGQVAKYIDKESSTVNNVEFIKVNIDDPEMAYLVAKFNVGFLPETIMIDGNGKTVMRKNGWIDRKTIAAGIAAAAKATDIGTDDSL